MSARRFAPGAALAALALAACFGGGDKQDPPRCPRASIVADAATVTFFRDGQGRDLTDVLGQGEIDRVLAQCEFSRRSIDIDLQIAIGGARGPAERTGRIEFEYFVAIVDADRNIAAKQNFKVELRFTGGRDRIGIVEQVYPRIPITERTRTLDYEILIGFQLTPDQMAWNQRRRGG